MYTKKKRKKSKCKIYLFLFLFFGKEEFLFLKRTKIILPQRSTLSLWLGHDRMQVFKDSPQGTVLYEKEFAIDRVFR